MLTWSPTDWGTAAFEVFGAFYFARIFYFFTLALIGAERAPYVVNVTIEKTEEC